MRDFFDGIDISIMSVAPTFFLIQYNIHGGCTAYTTGCNIFSIPNFDTVHIVRYYPSPPEILTSHITIFQRLWRLYLKRRKWFSHPRQLQYRQLYGRFPVLPPHLL